MNRVFQWLIGGGISAIGKQLNEAYQAKLEARNDHERIAADKWIAQLEAQQSVLLKEQSHKLTSWIRPAYAALFWVYLAKIIIYDKVLGLGVTDPLGGYLEEIMMTIIMAYFLTRPIEKAFRK